MLFWSSVLCFPFLLGQLFLFLAHSFGASWAFGFLTCFSDVLLFLFCGPHQDFLGLMYIFFVISYEFFGPWAFLVFVSGLCLLFCVLWFLGILCSCLCSLCSFGFLCSCLDTLSPLCSGIELSSCSCPELAGCSG